MIVLVQASVLTIGLNSRNKVLRELPIRLITMRSAKDAARSFKNEKVDSVISKCGHDGGESYRFLRKLKTVKPDIPTIVFIKSGDVEQEIRARSLGVSAVLTDDTTDDVFKQTVARVLNLKDVVSIKQITAVKN